MFVFQLLGSYGVCKQVVFRYKIKWIYFLSHNDFSLSFVGYEILNIIKSESKTLLCCDLFSCVRKGNLQFDVMFVK